MPYFTNTPEALLGRSDSKNPSTTCRGITANGRPCRRAIAAKTTSRPLFATPPRHSSVDDPLDEGVYLYCWQHKEQAGMSAKSSPGPRPSDTLLEERTSLDTLADRLGLVAQVQHQLGKPEKQDERRPKPVKARKPYPPNVVRPKPKGELQLCCCFRIPLDEVTSPPSRPRPRPLRPPSTSPEKPVSTLPGVTRRPGVPLPRPPRPSCSGSNHSPAHSDSSQTARYLSLIPQTASPQTASLLMAELAKPFSPQDEAGYIYIFWLTPDSQPADTPAEAARSLLAVPGSARATPGQRRPSDVLASFSVSTDSRGSTSRHNKSAPNETGDSRKILLKIGRTTNVQRRLSDWARQCGYNLSLIRYYPYVSSGSTGSVSVLPRKMPHSHKVERLIHIELAGRGMRVANRERCEACGREHREWFEVEATRQAVADVDEVVRRWVDWDELSVQ